MKLSKRFSKGHLEVTGGNGGIECPVVRLTTAIFVNFQFAILAQFMSTLDVECHPAITLTPIPVHDDEDFSTILKLTIWPHKGVSILFHFKLKTFACFVFHLK